MFKVISSSAAARIIQAALAFGAVLALAAVMAVDQFGVYMVTISAATILQYVASGWFTSAILRESGTDDGITQGDIDTFLGSLLLITALVWLAFGQLAFVICLVVFAEAAFTANGNLLAVREQWGRLSAVYVVRGVSAFAIPLAVAHYSGLAVHVLIAYAASVAGSAGAIRLFTYENGRSDVRRIKRSFVHYLPLSINSIIRQVFDRGDRLVVGALFGASAAGSYALAADVARRPIQLLGGSLQAVFLPRISRKIDQIGSESEMEKLWRLNGAILVWLCALASAASLIGLDLVFLRLFPGKYTDVLIYIALAASTSATLEAMDTFHGSIWLIASRRMRQMPLIYFGAAVLFLLVCGAAWYTNAMWLVLAGVVAANLVGFSGVLIMSRKSRSVKFDAVSNVLASAFFVTSATLWLSLRSLLDVTGATCLGVAIGIVGAATAAITLRRLK